MSKKIKVLMVDDEEKFRSTTRKILNKRGFETLVAGSGREALQQLDDNPDVVVLDIKMPGMDGHETLQEIKKRRPDLPVIMLTGHGEMPSAREALKHGANDYLTKPCDMDLLASKIVDVHHHGVETGETSEKVVADIMIAVEDYTTVNQNDTVGEAIARLRETFTSRQATDSIMETGHRSILVFDDKGGVSGILSILDLLQALMPAYLSAPKPSMADSIQYSPLFWTGMFTKEVKKTASLRVSDVMSPAPLTIQSDANLMEAAYAMVSNRKRRLAVEQQGRIIGIVREQDLFFEIERILCED